MTKEGGRFHQANAVFLISIAVMVIPMLTVTVIALLNPLWFRDDFLIFWQNTMEKFSRWRNRLVYRIYLGTDPTVWHLLKDAADKKPDNL